MAKNSLFEEFQKQLEKKGIDLTNLNSKEGSHSNILKAIVDKKHIPSRTAHSDHTSFPRHRSYAGLDNSNKCEDSAKDCAEDVPSQNTPHP